MRPPLRYPPSFLNDSPQARARFRQDYRVFLREAVQYLGAAEVGRDLHDIIKGRQGRIPDEERNALILAEYYSREAKGFVDKKGRVNRNKLAREFVEEHGEEFEAVRRQLNRLLNALERKAGRDRKLKAALQRPSLLGTVTK
jgi:hypothetical protein